MMKRFVAASSALAMAVAFQAGVVFADDGAKRTFLLRNNDKFVALAATSPALPEAKTTSRTTGSRYSHTPCV